MNADSIEEAIVQVVNLGNAADTAGAIAGALAGAYYGLSAIPERWREALHGEWPLGSGQIWTADDFVNLADQLATVDGSTGT
jgi:ADP-ribosyl-[dinitrogen reductase] hydrolase